MPITIKPTVLKYRNGHTFTEADCLKGSSGVHYGSTAPTDPDVNVWIDPSGTETSFVQDVQVAGTSIVSNGVANIPIATSSTPGVVIQGPGLVMQNNKIWVNKASENHIKGGVEEYQPLVPQRQHVATFYGLAKAAGDTTQSASSNEVGTYTDTAKNKICNMLDLERKMRLLKTITVSEAAQSVGFDTDVNGLPFQCDEFEMWIYIPTNSSSSNGQVTIAIETTTTASTGSKWVAKFNDAWIQGYSTINHVLLKRYATNWRSIDYIFRTSETDFTNAIMSDSAYVRTCINGASWVRSNNPLYATSLAVNVNDATPVGTYIEVYAHDYQL